MGWESRDWAKWTDEERARFLGASAPAPARRLVQYETRRSGGVLLAMLVSLALSFGAWHSHLFRRLTAPPAPALPAVVYGTGLAHDASDARALTCTAMATGSDGLERCTVWTYVQPGQRVVQAAAPPHGMNCPTVEADQRTGRWICS